MRNGNADVSNLVMQLIASYCRIKRFSVSNLITSRHSVPKAMAGYNSHLLTEVRID